VCRESNRDPGEPSPTPGIAVLVRRNRFIRPIIAALRERGIDASEEGGAPLADDPAVAATLSLLHLADHPTDELARFHVATSPLGVALNWNGVPSAASTRRRAAKLRRALATRGYAHVLERLLDRAAPHIPPASAARMDQLLDLARDFDARASLRPCEFVALVCEQRVARPGGARVRVMSIHAAKGLEFDAVVLPDLDAPSCPRGGCLALRPGNPLEPATALSLAVSKEVARLHPMLADMHRQRQKRLVFEDLCTLYVAMTRARRALVMLVSPYKKPDGPLTLKAASILRGCLDDWGAPAPEQSTLREWRRDSRPWWEGLAPQSAAGPAPAPPEPAQLTLAPPRPGSLRRARIVAPSSLDGALIDLGQRLAPGPSAGAAGMDIGTIAHAILQRIDWLDGPHPTDADLRAWAAAVLAATPHALETAVALVSRFLASPGAACLRRPWHAAHPALTSGSTSAPDPSLDLRREWAFLHEVPDADAPTLISGAIDRLVLLRDPTDNRILAADILDYKTDTIASDADLAARTAHHRPQLVAYSASIARMFDLDPHAVRATLVFLGAGRLVNI
jgi:ATP-dependent exoDNAse (exonuclease V) beta subunit